MLGAFALLGFAASAQTTGQLKIGANVGIPVGDASDFFKFYFRIRCSLSVETGRKFWFGYCNRLSAFFVKSDWKDAGGSDAGYIPLAASAQYSVSPNFFIGADLGYGFLTGKYASGGGFYYQPKVGYQQSNWELYLGYKGVSKDSNTLGSVNLGFNFKFR